MEATFEKEVADLMISIEQIRAILTRAALSQNKKRAALAMEAHPKVSKAFKDYMKITKRTEELLDQARCELAAETVKLRNLYA